MIATTEKRPAECFARPLAKIQWPGAISVAILLYSTLVLSNQVWADNLGLRHFFNRQDGVSVYFDLELANTTRSRSEGLMWRETLQPRAGMLFDFEHSNPIRMWMKNTLISLDMIFLDEQKKIVYIFEGAQPRNLEIIETPGDARFTVEINAGEVSRYGLSVGDSLFELTPTVSLKPAQ